MEKEQFLFFYIGILSQWHPSQFVIDSTLYNCCEQYMMACKARLMNDTDTLLQIMQTDHPSDQKKLGRKVKNFDIDLWNKYAKDIVFIGNYAKFTQNTELKKGLMNSRGFTLVEASPTDKIWGIGLTANDPNAWDRNTWQGLNWLGECITAVREYIYYQDLLSKKSFGN